MWRKRNPSLTHICLDELGALLSYLRDEAKHINYLLCVHHVDHGVNYNEGSSPPNTSAGDKKKTNKTLYEPQCSADTCMLMGSRRKQRELCACKHIYCYNQICFFIFLFTHILSMSKYRPNFFPP